MRFVEKRILEDTYWYSFNDEPIATVGSLIVPRLSDPSFLLPDESPDGLWHLFAHTWLGVEHYTSTSGLEWKKEHLVFLRGHSPFIYKEGNVYYVNSAVSRLFEETPFHPERLLKEYIKLFHPELLPDYQLVYYKKMGE